MGNHTPWFPGAAGSKGQDQGQGMYSLPVVSHYALFLLRGPPHVALQLTVLGLIIHCFIPSSPLGHGWEWQPPGPGPAELPASLHPAHSLTNNNFMKFSSTSSM